MKLGRVVRGFSAAVMTMMCAMPAFADSGRPIEVGITAEYWDVRDGDDQAWGPGIGIGIPIGDSGVYADLKASWFSDAGEDNLGDLSIVPVDFGLSYHFKQDKWEAIGRLGGTWANANFDRADDVPAFVDIDSDWGTYLGVGGSYFLSDNMAFTTDLNYRFIDFDIKARNDSAIYGGTYDANGLNLAIGLKWLL